MTIHDIDTIDDDEKRALLAKCCGSSAWVEKMLIVFPVEDLVELLIAAEEKWYECNEQDWREAFSHHPKIGDTESLKKEFASTADWAAAEQSGVATGKQQVNEALAKKNGEYEKKYGYIFILSASGKSAEEILGILESRLINSPQEEIRNAAEEQNKITQHRIQKLFA